jgi:hypothetical protein
MMVEEELCVRRGSTGSGQSRSRAFAIKELLRVFKDVDLKGSVSWIIGL